jgi:pimeloyl-ACP methyl ester carboxylesterase
VQADFVDAGGTKVFVRRWGEADAPAVFYWHGGGGGSTEWPEIAPVLAAAGYSVYAPEAPGYGRSPRLEPGQYLASNMADLAVSLVGELAIAPVLWVGFSWGATLGVHVAARAPERLRALALLDGGYHIPEMHPEYDPSLDIPKRIAEMQADLDRGEEWDAPPEVIAAVMQGSDDEPAYTRWPGVRAAALPVLLITSSKPPEWDEVRARVVDRFRAALPDAEVFSVDSGHGVLQEAGDDVRRIVLDWLARLP